MINKKTIKTHMPVLFNFVKSQPQLLKLAQRVNAKLQHREYIKLNNNIAINSLERLAVSLKLLKIIYTKVILAV